MSLVLFLVLVNIIPYIKNTNILQIYICIWHLQVSDKEQITVFYSVLRIDRTFNWEPSLDLNEILWLCILQKVWQGEVDSPLSSYYERRLKSHITLELDVWFGSLLFDIP